MSATKEPPFDENDDEKPTDEKFEAKGKDSLAEEDVEEAADKLRLLEYIIVSTGNFIQSLTYNLYNIE